MDIFGAAGFLMIGYLLYVCVTLPHKQSQQKLTYRNNTREVWESLQDEAPPVPPGEKVVRYEMDETLLEAAMWHDDQTVDLTSKTKEIDESAMNFLDRDSKMFLGGAYVGVVRRPDV